MNDILQYVKTDPVYRKWDHRHLTFSMLYAFNENFILPFSHDEVVHGKGSMFGKIPGDDWQKAATLRTLYGFMYAHPGKKLMFMGDEFGQKSEWDHDRSLDWDLVKEPLHAGLQRFVRDLNRIYAAEPALHEVDFDFSGFQWIDCNDSENSVVSFIRRSKSPGDFLVAVLNFTPVPREGYRIGVPDAGVYTELVNSDACFLRRRQRWQRRRREHRTVSVTRLRTVHQAAPAAARVPAAQAHPVTRRTRQLPNRLNCQLPEASRDLTRVGHCAIFSIRAHSCSLTGITDSLESLTSANVANALSALMDASVTGRASFFTAPRRRRRACRSCPLDPDTPRRRPS